MSQSLNGKGLVQILVGIACLGGAWYYGHVSSANSDSGIEPPRVELNADDLVWNSSNVQAPPLQNGSVGSLTEHVRPVGNPLDSASASGNHQGLAGGSSGTGPMLAPPDFSQLNASIEQQRAAATGSATVCGMSPLSANASEPSLPQPTIPSGFVRPWSLVEGQGAVPGSSQNDLNDRRPRNENSVPLAAGQPIGNWPDSTTHPQPVSVLRPLTDGLTAGLQPLSTRENELEISASGFKIHVVRPGETLQSLSREYFGSSDYYLDIYAMNQDLLSSPAAVRSGLSLRIPTGLGQ